MTPTELGLLGIIIGGGGGSIGAVVVSALKSRFLVRRDLCELRHQGLDDILREMKESNRRDFDEIKTQLKSLNGRRINP